MSADLCCLVADRNMEAALAALLGQRSLALGIRPLTWEVHVHPQRDPGCYRTGTDLLRGLLGDRPGRGLLVLDQAWDGNPHPTAAETEAAIRARLNDLAPRAEVLVLDPELEAWVWSDSPHVAEVLGWRRPEDLHAWLAERGLWDEGAIKPADPKAAVERVLRETRIPRSSSLYRALASRVGLQRCEDPAFGRLRAILQAWFRAAPTAEPP